jgi:hypothetical protein
MRRFFLAILLIGLLPAAAYAQASIAGQVRDVSGAVLPGVTVEAASPALIEKVRTVVTDGTGQYRIDLLPPGAYTVTFTLTGFNSFKRDGITLSGTFTASVDAELRVGAIEETVTVTGEAPIVDVQSATRQQVMDRDLIDDLPTSRSPFALSVLIPGVSVAAANQDVGGATQASGAVQMQVHGSTGNSTLIMENGLSTAALVGAWGSQLAFNMAATQEVAVDTGGAAADANAAGVKMNVIPREGGNTFNGTFFANGTTGALQGNNFSQRLKDAGLRSPDEINKIWDINPGFGGPLKRDRLWFYGAARYSGNSRWVAGEYLDKNFNNPNVWLYEPDLSQPVSNDGDVKDGRLRISWQAASNVKIGASYQQQTACNCPRDINSTRAYEATPKHFFPLERQVLTDVTSPVTNRLLIDGAIMHKVERAIRDQVPGLSPLMINVLEQSTGRQYRARDSYINRPSYQYVYRAAVSYITGAHSVKVGAGDISGYFSERDFDNQPVSYRFNNGVPNQITMRAYPIEFKVDVDHQFGAYVQDRWAVNRLTLNLGARWDYFGNHFREQGVGPVPLAPARDITFPETKNLSWHDLNPKLSGVYDLFGDGKTALKASLNRYVEQYTVNGIAGARNPISTLVNSTTRSWADANRNYVPDCDLLNLAGNGECGGVANTNFGKAIPGATFDDDLLTGWGKRDYNWEFSVGAQREIVPRVSADVAYFRRWYGNLQVTDNLTVTPADYDTYSILVPSDPRLPGGGGYQLTGLVDLKPAKFGQPANNFTTLASRYGDLVQRWDGIDLAMNARLATGVFLQGGMSTGRTTVDTCDVVDDLPEMLFGVANSQAGAVLLESNANVLLPAQFCRQQSPFLTQWKFLGSYTVPKIDVQVSGTLQSLPGPHILANYNVPTAVVATSLGRPLSGNAANAPIQILEPGSSYGERLNQLDFRFGKTVRLAETRTTFSVDIYNALNVDTVLALNNNFAAWQRPTSFMLARFVKFGIQFDF